MKSKHDSFVTTNGMEINVAQEIVNIEHSFANAMHEYLAAAMFYIPITRFTR